MTEPPIAEMSRRYEAGQSLKQIADDLGYWPGVVRRFLIRAGVTMRSPGTTEYSDAISRGQRRANARRRAA